MSARLETQAEVLKLARLLDVDPARLDALADVPAGELRRLREGVTDSVFDAGAASLKRVALGARLIPSPLVATIAVKSFGPLLCARAAGAIDPGKAIDVATRLPADFLSDVTVHLDPRRVADIITRVPASLVVPVATELGRRGEYVTMGRFLAYLPDANIVAAMTALDDEALLRTAFVLEHKERLDHALGLLPPERLPGIIAGASALGLWPEALDLLEHLTDARRGPVADVVADQPHDVVASLVDAASEAHLWPDLLPVVRAMSPEHRLRLAAAPAFHTVEVLAEIVDVAARSGLWLDLVPLLRALPAEVFALVPPIVVALPDDLLATLIREAVEAADVLEPFADILAALDDDAQDVLVAVIEADGGALAPELVDAVRDPRHVRLLLDHTPARVLAAVEQAADRLGLRAEYDDAVASAG